MKTLSSPSSIARSILKTAVLPLLLAGSIATASAVPIVWDPTKTGEGASARDWGTATDWLGGEVPGINNDVYVGNLEANTRINNANTFKTLLVESGGGNTVVQAITSTAFSSGAISIKGIDGLANFSTGARTTTDFTVSGAILVEGTDDNTGRFSSSGAVTFKATSLVLGGNGSTSRAANMKIIGPSDGETQIYDIPTVIFNNGSILDSSTSWSGGTIRFTGDVLLRAGGYTGRTPQFAPVRNGDYATIRIDGNMTMETGELVLRSRANWEIGEDLTVGNGAKVFPGTDSGSALNYLSVEGSLALKTGGEIDVSGDNGGLEIRVARDFTIETNSKLLLGTGTSQTNVKLGGNFDLKATGLTAGSNFNTLRLALTGGGETQGLEVAVIDGNTTFAVSRLALDGSLVMLENNTLNLAAEEYFLTGELVNTGDSTLILNGLRFFVGDPQADGFFLAPGIYNDFGGTLTVVAAVPEPSTVWLLGATALGIALWRRRASLRRAN